MSAHGTKLTFPALGSKGTKPEKSLGQENPHQGDDASQADPGPYVLDTAVTIGILGHEFLVRMKTQTAPLLSEPPRPSQVLRHGEARAPK